MTLGIVPSPALLVFSLPDSENKLEMERATGDGNFLLK